jgi:methyl-accepting chemotaxis protein
MERRRIYFIEKNFQRWFIIRFCMLVLLGFLFTGILLYLFAERTTTVSFENTKAVVKSTADYLFPILVQTIIIVTIFVAIMAIMLTLFVSHKIGGPLYRLKKELNAISEGDLSSDFKIRKEDQLQDVAKCLNDMKAKLRERIKEIKAKTVELKEIIVKLNLPEEDKAKIERHFESLQQAVNCFKTD